MGRVFQQLIEYYSILLGVTTLRFDYEQHKIYKSKFWNIYTVFWHIALLWTMPYAFNAGVIFMESYSNNTLLLVVDSVAVAFNFTAIIFTMLLRWQREKKSQRIALELFDIDMKYFDHQPLLATIERHFNYLLYGKLFFCFIKSVATCSSIFEMSPIATAETFVERLLLAIYYIISVNILYSIMFYYFYMLCHVGKRFQQLNVQLEQTLQHLLLTSEHSPNVDVAVAAVMLHDISRIHMRLTNLLLQLNDTYKYQTLAVLLSYTLCNMTFGYYVVILLNGSINATPDIVSWIFSALVITSLFIDITQLYWICEDITVAYQHTSDILRLGQLLPHAKQYAALERQCEIFCMQLMQRKLKINIGGNFDLSRQTALTFWAFTVTHVLILMQFNIARSV